MFDVTALGEYLIDFSPAGRSESGNPLLEQNPGGAPANVLAALSRLGGTGAFIGKVGSDAFGDFLRDVLLKNQIEARGLRVNKTVHTTLAFVSLNGQGDRSFSFYRNPGADLTLESKEVDFSLIDNARIFHFGSLSMTAEPSRSATTAAVRYAKKQGRLISYDPNYRPALWKNTDEAVAGMRFGLEYADILKVSDEELYLLTGCQDIGNAVRGLMAGGIKIVFVTMGAKGCYFGCGGETGYLGTYDTRVVDTTGSGDAFLGAALYRISRFREESLPVTLNRLSDIVDFSNAAGALCAQKKGAIPAMPTLGEIEECRRSTAIIR